jgi:hypothetical protein
MFLVLTFKKFKKMKKFITFPELKKHGISIFSFSFNTLIGFNGYTIFFQINKRKRFWFCLASSGEQNNTKCC